MYNLVERYIAAADGEVVTVKYSKQPHGHGRLFAKRGVSMQYIAREIRNAIAHPFYMDLDFVNCHPSLLSQKCQPRRKLAVLSVLNGGHKAVRVHKCSSQWLGDFYNEIKQSPPTCWVLRAPSNAYMDIAKKDGNTRASALTIMLCDIENECLMSMKDYLHQHHFVVGVLMFDGAMVEKKVDIESGGITAEMLQDISHYIFDRTACMRSNIKFIDDGGNARKYSCIISKSTAIAKNIRHFAPKDNSFRDNIWESNIGVLCFNNGVYDFLDKSFTPI
eukprot:gene26711-biopygen4014